MSLLIFVLAGLALGWHMMLIGVCLAHASSVSKKVMAIGLQVVTIFVLVFFLNAVAHTMKSGYVGVRGAPSRMLEKLGNKPVQLSITEANLPRL